MAKALYWAITDTHGRKLGEQNGFGTRVVLAVNDGYSVLRKNCRTLANALSIPPGEYARKGEIQRN